MTDVDTGTSTSLITSRHVTSLIEESKLSMVWWAGCKLWI